MKTAYTIEFANVQHIGTLNNRERVRIGNVLLGPVPFDSTNGMSPWRTAAVVQVDANTAEEAEKLAVSSLENAITVLTYVLCRQAMVELPKIHDEFDGDTTISQVLDEDSDQRIWRRQLQGVPEDSPDEGESKVLVMNFTRFRLLHRFVSGNLERFVSDRTTQMLWQILSGDFEESISRTDKVHIRHMDSVGFAATYLRRSMESRPPHDLIDAFSGLETLFADGTTPIATDVGDGVAYTSASRNDPSAIEDIQKSVKDLYNDRSRLVHGDHLVGEISHAASTAEKMLVESIGFCLMHENMIVECGGIKSWLGKIRLGCREALEPKDGLSL